MSVYECLGGGGVGRRFSVSLVCTFLTARHFMLASVWCGRLKMSRDISVCVCIDIRPVLVKSGLQTVLCFHGVLNVAASVTIEKVHDAEGIASDPVSDYEHLACSVTSESSCLHQILLAYQPF